MPEPRVRYNIRMPAGLMAELQEEHAKTYPQHRQKFAAWLCSLLQMALDAR